MDGKCVIKLTGHTARVTGLAACPRSKLLLSCSDDGTPAAALARACLFLCGSARVRVCVCVCVPECVRVFVCVCASAILRACAHFAWHAQARSRCGGSMGAPARRPRRR
jgi:hypothetical protein